MSGNNEYPLVAVVPFQTVVTHHEVDHTRHYSRVVAYVGSSESPPIFVLLKTIYFC